MTSGVQDTADERVRVAAAAGHHQPPPRSRLNRLVHGLPRRLAYVWGPRLMSAIRKRLILIKNGHAEVSFGRHVYIGPGFSLHMPLGGTFVVGDGVEFRRGFRAELERTARVTIGAGSTFTNTCLIQCATAIDIGERVHVGQATLIVDGNHRYDDPNLPLLDQGYDYRRIVVGDDVAITTKCTVIASIGEHCFIGANSVVVDDIPPFSLAAGSPAIVRRSFGPPRDDGGEG